MAQQEQDATQDVGGDTGQETAYDAPTSASYAEGDDSRGGVGSSMITTHGKRQESRQTPAISSDTGHSPGWRLAPPDGRPVMTHDMIMDEAVMVFGLEGWSPSAHLLEHP